MPAKCKLLMLIFIAIVGEKGIFQISSYIQDTRGYDNLLKQWNHLSYSSCNCSHHLVKLTIIHCHSLRSTCLLHRPNGQAKWRYGGNHHPFNFQVLDGNTNFFNPPGIQYCFWFPIWLGRGSFSGFHLAFPTIISFTAQVREPVWGLCQLLNIFIPIVYSRIEEITTGWVQGTTRPTLRWTWAIILLILWLHNSLL